MRFFPRRKRSHEQAEAAVEESQVNLEDTLSTRMEVDGIVARLARIRQQDHFEENIRVLLTGEG